MAQGKLREACTERSEVTQQILHFVQDDTSCQILRLTPQNDITTQSLKGKIRLGNFHVLWEAIRPWVIGYKIKVVCLKVKVNPVRNSSGALNPALRGRTPCGAEPGIILKPLCSRRPRGPLGFESQRLARREQRGIISNGVKKPVLLKGYVVGL